MKDQSVTFAQLDVGSNLPPPSYVHRVDVEELCVAACDFAPSCTMGIRAVGEIEGKKKPQGTKEDGCTTIQACLVNLTEGTSAEIAMPTSKHYGLAVGLVVYNFFGATLAITGLINSLQGVGKSSWKIGRHEYTNI
jgi:hypothetical protein